MHAITILGGPDDRCTDEAADRFFSEHGFGPSRSYELIWDHRRYPHKAILGTAYELATGQRLGSGDFEGGKSGAVAILTKLGFTIQNKQ